MCQERGAGEERLTKDGGVQHGLVAPAPPGVTHPGFAERKPSEIPSRTQSVSAFLLDKASVGRTVRRIRSTTSVRAAELVRRPGVFSPLLRRSPLRTHAALPSRVSLPSEAQLKIRGM